MQPCGGPNCCCAVALLGNFGTARDRFPPGPPAGGWQVLEERSYMRCLGPADAERENFCSFCRCCFTWRVSTKQRDM